MRAMSMHRGEVVVRWRLGAVAACGAALVASCDLPPYIPPWQEPDTVQPDTIDDGDGDGSETISCGIEPKLSDIRAKYFSLSCVFGGCHESSSQEGDLDLETSLAWEQLVNVPAAHEKAVGKIRVVPGDPDASFLIQKLDGTLERDEGDLMPQGIDEPIDPACRIRMIRQWISDGALNN